MGPPLSSLTATRLDGIGAFVEHDFFFPFQDQRSLGAHHDFAIAPVAVAVNRRVGHDDPLIGVIVVGTECPWSHRIPVNGSA